MSIIIGPLLVPSTPEDAVVAAFKRHDLADEHVVVEVLDQDIGVWTWRLTADAPKVLDSEVVTVEGVVGDDGMWRPTAPAGHPSIEHGIVVASEFGWLVVVRNQHKADEDLVQAAQDLDAGEKEPGSAGQNPATANLRAELS